MTGQAFLAALEQELRGLSTETRAEALAFFKEYVAEAGDDLEAIAALGSPEVVAKELMEELRARDILEEQTQELVSVQTDWVQVDKITAELIDIDLKIKVADVPRVSVNYDDRLSKLLSVTEQDGVLAIKQLDRLLATSRVVSVQLLSRVVNFSKFTTGISRMEVLVPRGLVLPALQITSEHSDVALFQLVADKVSVTLGDGDLEVKGGQIAALLARLSNGDLDITDGIVSQGVLTLANGDLDVTGSRIDEVRGKLANGDMEISASRVPTAVFDLSNGDVELAETDFSDMTIKVANGDVEVLLSDHQKAITAITATAVWGEYDVFGHSGENNTYHHQPEKNQASLTVTSASGDIEIH